MTPAQRRSLIAQFIEEELDEWEGSIVARGFDERVNGQWQDCLSALSQDRVDELTAELRQGVPASVDVSEFVQRHKLDGAISPDSVEWKLLGEAAV